MSSNDAYSEAKARAKALRPWWKKKRFVFPLGFVILIALGAVASGGGDKDSNVSSSGAAAKTAEHDANDNNAKLFTGRPDSQKEDQERNVGESAKLSGYTATVTAANFQQKVSDFEDKGYIVVEVAIENRDDKSQSYNLLDWRLQTPDGQVIDPTFVSVPSLGSGDLVNGGKVSGRVVFEVGAAKGDFFVIYKPDPYDAARGIWKATA